MKLLHLYTDEAQMHRAYSIEYTLLYVGKGTYKTNIDGFVKRFYERYSSLFGKREAKG